MDPKDRINIWEHIESLAQKLDLNSNLINQVINKNIFNKQMIDDILKKGNEMDRKKLFLSDLRRRGPDAVDQLVEILYGVGQEEVARVLRPNIFRTGNNAENIVANITSPPSVQTPQTPSVNADPSLSAQDSGDNQTNGTLSSVENDDYMINVQKCRTAFSGVNIYRMTSNPRGFTLIFNIHEFKNGCYDKRFGSEAESNRLRDVFTQLHFTVKVFNNSTKEEMLKIFEEFRTKPELKLHDCLIIIVLTHGQSGYCVGSDGYGLQFEDIIHKFNNENCPQLIGCPKLFFFSCCRGDNRDTGPRYSLSMDQEEAVADAKKFVKSIIPTANDMMICYSTVDGYVSWRNEENGSWFGTALCNSLMKNAHSCDLHHILTYASSTITNKTTQNGEKQVMEYTFRGFTKLFYFNPGIPPHSSASSE